MKLPDLHCKVKNTDFIVKLPDLHCKVKIQTLHLVGFEPRRTDIFGFRLQILILLTNPKMSVRPGSNPAGEFSSIFYK